MVATITGQQKAFAAGDFAAARSFASESFRSTVMVDEFQALIEREYAFLLDDPSVTFARCARVDRVAEVEVNVEGPTTRTMVYRLVEGDGGWAIDGARLTEVSSGIAA